MEKDHQTCAVSCNDDIPHLDTERPATAQLCEISVAARPVPKAAWSAPTDSCQQDFVNKFNKQRQNARRKQSLWLMRTKRFCNEASVVGLRYVVNPSASPFRRSIWVLLLVAGAAFTTFQIQNRIRYFLSRPVNVNLRIEHAEEIRFPTVTVCNENRIMRSTAAYFGITDAF